MQKDDMEYINEKPVMINTFEQDTALVAEQASTFLKIMQPSHLVLDNEVKDLVYENSAELLDAFCFFKIKNCSVDNDEDITEELNNKMSKFYTAIYQINKPIAYGVVSYEGETNMVLGVYSENNEVGIIKSIIQGLLDGIEIEEFTTNYTRRLIDTSHAGFISGVPTIEIDDEKQTFDIGTVMKTLNGQNYSLLFVSRPVDSSIIASNYGKLVQVRDACFAVSKRNVSRQQGTSHSVGNTEGKTETYTSSMSNTKGGSFGINFILINKNWSKSKTTSESNSISENISKTVTDAINNTEGESHDIQNGFALEMMEYSDKAIERLRRGKVNGMWETLISYSTDSKIACQIIESCVYAEMSKPNHDLLPVVSKKIELDTDKDCKNILAIPKILKNEIGNSRLCTMVTSEELGFMCTPPSRSVPNFEIKVEKSFPLISEKKDGVIVGNLNDGIRSLDNMPFVLTEKDLARHTFVCGITGSGKTTTVKRILDQANKPFLVIESAKTEYRSMKLLSGEKPSVYTLGRPEINCIVMNPFYIQNGVSPQMHIDLLKDLFNASFSFYGPMPYILEKCLHNIYKSKGWNLTLGYHPFFANTNNLEDFFDSEHVSEMYRKASHKYLFPTMQDLKDEVERYIENELNYEGEIAGNIKTAIKTRLENLCCGSKGYMFNTYDYLDMDKLLNEKAVFELEGLADDADKAFTVGLAVIFVNEYRQTQGKLSKSKGSLSHLLVIEEAHRLLKNVATEKASEDMGNPKGKAVEHFTNMIAEMRSYGQGVIVAEQIPTKLAPDVIKNSSNKIIQRLVAEDDQKTMANTIGIGPKDAMQIGTICTGQAFCHKEGMTKPVKVSVKMIEDIKVTDSMLYSNSNDRIKRINMSILNEAIGNQTEVLTIKLLNAILMQEELQISKSIEIYRKEIKKLHLKNGIGFVAGGQEKELQSHLITRLIIQFLMRGIYRVKSLLDDETEKEIFNLIQNPISKHIEAIREYLKKAYNDDPKYKGGHIIAMLVAEKYEKGMDMKKIVEGHFIVPDDKTTNMVIEHIKEG